MLSQVIASPCLWVSKHFPGYQGYFISGFIGYFAFSGKQFTLVQAIPSSPSPTKVKIPLLWSQTREVCPSSPSGLFADLFASLLVMDIQFTWFSIQKWNIFFPLSTWEWLGNPPACVLATALQWAGCWGKTSAWLKSSWLWEMLWFCPGMEVLIKKVLRVTSWET